MKTVNEIVNYLENEMKKMSRFLTKVQLESINQAMMTTKNGVIG